MTFNEIFKMVMESFLVAVSLGVITMIPIGIVYYVKNKKYTQLLYLFIFLVYIYMLLYITIFRGGLFKNEIHSINLIPFDELIQSSYYQVAVLGKTNAFIIFGYNVFGNIIWFFPFGIFLCSAFHKMTFKKVILYSFLLSFSIEILQYLFYTGVSDIDDIIFNVTGGILGYFCYRIIHRKKEGED